MLCTILRDNIEVYFVYVNMNLFLFFFQDCLGHAHVLLAAFERVSVHYLLIQ